jgi:hypothetical protein
MSGINTELAGPQVKKDPGFATRVYHGILWLSSAPVLRTLSQCIMRLPFNHTWASPSSLFAKSKRRVRKEGEIFLLEEWRRKKKHATRELTAPRRTENRKRRLSTREIKQRR